MANKRISDLTETLSLSGSEVFPIVSEGITKKIQINTLQGYIEANSITSSLSSKWDSVYSNVEAGSASWNSAYTNLVSNSAAYLESEVTTIVQANSANWNSVYSNVESSSANWDSVYSNVETNSANWDSVYSNVESSSANWNSAFTAVNSSSANWDSVYSSVESASANWDSVYSNVESSSANWDSVYSSVESSSANWDSVYSNVESSSANWNSVYSNVESSSANWNSVYSNVESSSANWDSVYSNVESNSANWDSVYSEVEANSANWDSVYSNVQANSANWDSVYSKVNSASANWDSVYSEVEANSANWGSVYSNVNSVSGSWSSVYSNVRANSANWESTYHTVEELSPNWDTAYSILEANQSKWDSVYSNVRSNSGTYATTDFTNSTYLHLTGGTITGKTRFNSDVTIFGDLSCTGTQTFANTVFTTTSALSIINIGTGPALYVGNNGPGDIASFYDIDQGIEVLHVGGANSTNPNVGVKVSNPNKDLTVSGEISASNIIWDSKGNSDHWNLAYTNLIANSSSYLSGFDSSLVSSASANWNSVYTTVSSASANWNSVYTTVSSASANWNSVYSNVGSASANWNSVYTTVSFASAKWNTDYLPLTGGTITDGLSVVGGLSATKFFGDGSGLTGITGAGTSSTRVSSVFVVGIDAPTIQGCIDLCTNAGELTGTGQNSYYKNYVIQIPPGKYIENLTLKKGVHLVGYVNAFPGNIAIIEGHHTFASTSTTGTSNRINIQNLYFTQKNKEYGVDTNPLFTLSNIYSAVPLSAAPVATIDMQDCYINAGGSSTAGIVLSAATEMHIAGTEFGTRYVTLTTNDLPNGNYQNFAMFDVSNTASLYLMKGCRVESCSGRFIRMSGTTPYVEVNNSYISVFAPEVVAINAEAGLYVQGFTTMENAALTGHGIKFQTSPTATSTVGITNGVFIIRGSTPNSYTVVGQPNNIYAYADLSYSTIPNIITFNSSISGVNAIPYLKDAISITNGGTGATTAAAALTNLGAVPTSRTITAGTGLGGGGNLTTNRTLSVVYGSTASTACEGNDSRLSNARTPTGAAGGDLSGTYPNPTVAKIQTFSVATTTPTNGQALVWNGTTSKWEPSTISSGGATDTTKLPLSGGVLTGALSGTTATFTTSVSAPALSGTFYGDVQLQGATVLSNPTVSHNGQFLEIYINGTKRKIQLWD